MRASARREAIFPTKRVLVYETEVEVDQMNDMWRVIGIIALGLVVLVIGVPLLLAAAGIVLGGIGMIIGLAVAVIKLAVVAAIGYLVLVAIRALMR